MSLFVAARSAWFGSQKEEVSEGGRERVSSRVLDKWQSQVTNTRLPRSPLVLGSPSYNCEKLGHIAFKNHVQEGCHTGSGMYQDVETGKVSTSACQHMPMILQWSSLYGWSGLDER